MHRTCGNAKRFWLISKSINHKTMKTTIFTFLTIITIAALFSCNQKKAQDAVDETANPTTETPTPDEPEVEPEKAYQVVGYQKTACFGKCPVYQVKFYSDNTATWFGKMNVDRMGWYEARLEGKVLKDIRDKAFEVGYFDFYGEYPVKYKVADLPSTKTYIRVGDMEKSITNTHDGPAKLTEFEEYLEGIIERLAWKASARD